MNWVNDIKNPYVNELLWALISEPILDSSSFSEFSISPHNWWLEIVQSNKELFLHLESNPTSLIEFLDSSNPTLPLGKRFEKLIHYFLSNVPETSLLESNIQVFQKHKTLGEIDFIFKELDTHSLMHLEVACKFYLQIANSTTWQSFVGPNGKDTLRNKIKTTQRQLQLSKNPLFLEQFPQFDEEEIQSNALIKGFIFHHFKKIPYSKKPMRANKNYNAGWYAFASEIKSFLAPNNSWIILERRNWLNPLLQQDAQVLSSEELVKVSLSHFRTSKQALALVQVIQTGEEFLEISRGFLIHDKWPSMR